MTPRRISLSGVSLPSGLFAGLLLGLVESLLVALVPVDTNLTFYTFIILMLLLYLLVPFFASLYAWRRGTPPPGGQRMGCRIGLICASLVILAPIIVYLISTAHVSVGEVGGFSGLRLAGDVFSVVITLILINAVGVVLARMGGWLGGKVGARRARSTKEQE